MKMFLVALTLVTAGLSAGCTGSTAAPSTAPEAQYIGRYQFIGRKEYDDGTVEYACLDTATGLIGYATIYPDANKAMRSLTNFNCAN